MSHSNIDPPFSPLKFLFVITASFSAYLFCLIWFFPNIWEIQLLASGKSLFWTFVAFSGFNCFMESLFHRYVLHAPLISYILSIFKTPKWILSPLKLLFDRLYKQHDKVHHPLTFVAERRVSSTSETLIVRNKYPIKEIWQHEASYFPEFTFLGFGVFLLAVFVPAQYFFPSAPIFLGGLLALTTSLFLYEIRHAIDHWPESRLEPIFNLPLIGSHLHEFYKIHLGHHAVVQMNMNISGFFLIPLADLLLGTYKKANTFYVDGEPAAPGSFEAPRPLFFIRWLDRLAEKAVSVHGK